MDKPELKRQLKTANYRLQRQRNINTELSLSIARLEGTIKSLEFINKLLKKERKEV